MIDKQSEQEDAGKSFVSSILAELVAREHSPWLAQLEFRFTDCDFDRGEVSLVDTRDLMRPRVVSKLSRNQLADSDATSRKKIRQQIESDVRSYILAHIAKPEAGT